MSEIPTNYCFNPTCDHERHIHPDLCKCLYLESPHAEMWSCKVNNTDIMEYYEMTRKDLERHQAKVDELRAELYKWESGLKVTEYDFNQLSEVAESRGLFGEAATEGPERYMCGTDLW